MRVLVTGANGFLGGHVCPRLIADGHDLALAVRDASSSPPPAPGDVFPIGDISPETEWRTALDGVDAVVHLAARAHVLKEDMANPGAEYRRVNADGTERLARQAAEAGVGRFIFMSSVKVNGERTAGRALTEADKPEPVDGYGISKWAAERRLAEIAAETGLETVTLRPPLVYGAGVKGNFLRLLSLCRSGWPVPLGAVKNRRSLIYAGNLAEATLACLSAPAAAGKTYFVRDSEDVSTPGLLRAVAAALGRPPRLVPVPVLALQWAGAVSGRSATIERLTESLQVDDTALRRDLNWAPSFTLTQGLEHTAAWFMNRDQP